MKKEIVLFSILVSLLSTPCAMAAIDINTSDGNVQVTEGQIKDTINKVNVSGLINQVKNATAATEGTGSLWQRFSAVVDRFNVWMEKQAGIHLVGLLKSLWTALVVSVKWMIRLLEFGVSKLHS